MTDFQYHFATPPPIPPIPTPGLNTGETGGGSGAFGSGAFGAMSFGSGGGAAITEAEQVTLNSVRVHFAGDVSIKNRGAIFDALYDRGWRISNYSDPNAHVPFVYWVEREDESTVVLLLDAPLDGPDVVYAVTVSPAIVGESGDAAERTQLFRTFGAPRSAPVSQQTRRTFDIANVPAGESGPGQEPPLGTFEIASDGDYRNDAGLENYRKRVIRRLTTKLGRFSHLHNYGLDMPEKGMMRPGIMRQIQSQAIAQVYAEQGTLPGSVTVSVGSPSPGIFRLSVFAGCISGEIGIDVTVGDAG